MKTQPKPIDFYQHVSLQVKSLQIMWIWFYIPHPKTSVWFWLHVLVRIVTGILFYTAPPLCQIAYVVKLLASGNFEIQHIASSINLILMELLVSSKLLDMFCRRGLLTQLMNQLTNGKFHRTHRSRLEKAIKISRMLFWGHLLLAALDIFFHMIVVPSVGGFQTLPVKMDLIFVDANQPPYFGYVCFYQIMYKPPILLTIISLQSLPWALLSFAKHHFRKPLHDITVAQQDILIDNFKNMASLVKVTMAERKCRQDQAYKEVFTSFVLHHRAIISYLKTADAALGGQFALTLILCSCVMCFTGVQFMSIEAPSKNLAAVFWVFAYLQINVLYLFTDCYFGNSVVVKSTDLATAAYGAPWLDMPQDLKKNLVLVMARAQKPLVITAYKLVPVTLPTFAKVMDWTYKAFAVMNGMKK